MRQVLQSANTGRIEVAEVPAPKLLPGCVLVRIAASVLSTGTERASAEFASKNLLQKAQARPDLVKQVMDKVRRDGLLSAVTTARSRLDRPVSLGYSSAGTVIAVADDVRGIQIGDRVACAGAGYAVHAEISCIPRLLVAKIPETSLLSFEEAAFTTLGAVALHGLRVADVKLGSVVGVIGLGLIGQLTVQLLKASGCNVVGFDINPERARLASELGADATCSSPEYFQSSCFHFSSQIGVDAVLITAETPSSDPANLAAEVARDRATVVAVGAVGMELGRKKYYEKELEFRISRSYGPGRYDTAYEQNGRDYPIGYVRWTETRNMEAFLQIASDRKIDLRTLITHRFPIEHAEAAYGLIMRKDGEPFLGVMITYPDEPEENRRLELLHTRKKEGRLGEVPKIGMLGAGNFATATLIPAIRKTPHTQLHGICAATGASARHAGKKFGFRYCTTDENELFSDPEINAVVIGTRHHLHASQVIRALGAGKHVFCEKPICLNERELSAIVSAHAEAVPPPLLMVGFNRRFAPMTTRLKDFLSSVKEPLVMHYRINAGMLPADHWTSDPEQGGGRIIGEVCHFIDLLGFLAGAMPIEVRAQEIASPTSPASASVMVALQFSNGSYGTVSYLANGDSAYSKERLEIFGGGSVAVLEDFRRLELVHEGRKKVLHSRLRQDKGHQAEWEAFAEAIQAGGESPIPFNQIVGSTLATLSVLLARRTGENVKVDVPGFLASSTLSNHLTLSRRL